MRCLGRTGKAGRVALWFAAFAPALGFWSLVASARGGRVPAGGKYADACTQGNARYATRDLDGAIASYRSAIELDPQNPLGHYLLGEAELASGRVSEAEAAYGRASLAAGDNDPAMHARALFVLADLKERLGQWDDAKAAWQAYIDWTERFPDAGAFPESARSRQQVIDAVQKQQKSLEFVRRRIAETADGGVFSDLSKPSLDASN